MNWEAIGAAGEILGALAVVASIVYLSSQIRSNTRATKASAGFEAAHSWAISNEVILGLETTLKSNAVESYRPEPVVPAVPATNSSPAMMPRFLMKF